MTDCIACEQSGRQHAATHRLVARGLADQRDESGNRIFVYADASTASVCEECRDAIMAAGWKRSRRMLLDVLALLQQSAVARGLTYAAGGPNVGAAFDWGFADLGKPMWLVSAEFTDPSLYRDGAVQPESVA